MADRLQKCVDVTLAEPEDVEEVTPQNCYNSTNIAFDMVFTMEALSTATGAAPSQQMSRTSLAAIFVGLVVSAWSTFS